MIFKCLIKHPPQSDSGWHWQHFYKFARFSNASSDQFYNQLAMYTYRNVRFGRITPVLVCVCMYVQTYIGNILTNLMFPSILGNYLIAVFFLWSQVSRCPPLIAEDLWKKSSACRTLTTSCQSTCALQVYFTLSIQVNLVSNILKTGVKYPGMSLKYYLQRPVWWCISMQFGNSMGDSSHL